jgi:hypothetical protein
MESLVSISDRQPITPQQAAVEKLRRQRARSSLAEYSQCIDIPGVPLWGEGEDDPLDSVEDGQTRIIEKRPTMFVPIETRIALHHLVMMMAIQRCIETPRGRLMIFAPPGSAKSTYASVVAPSWAMGRKRNQSIILGGYGTSIAAKQSRKVRAVVKEQVYTALWESAPRLLDDQRAIDDWSLTNGSSMMAAGLLAGITGNRADGFVIDDPVANREQADSSTIRDKTYQEYIDTVMTRAKPKMWCILIQTRWHEEDLAGAILPANYEGESGRIHCRDGQWWEVLCIPAKAERADDPLGRKPGEYLWPEWFPREHWSTWEDNPRAARTWSALYQQRPAPLAGIHFSREMFKLYDPYLQPL